MEGTIFQTISEFITNYLPIAVSVIGTFSIIATATPNKSDDAVVDVLLKIVNFLGANVANAKNA